MGSCVIDVAPELRGRLRYREPVEALAHGPLHALLLPECVREGRLWWRAALHACPQEAVDYLDSAWRYDDSAIVGTIFVATAGAGRRLEVRIEALEGSAILCDAILESPWTT